MVTVPDRLTRRALLARGYRDLRVPTSVGSTSALVGPGRGAVPPVVFVHGFAGAAVHWAVALPFVAGHTLAAACPDAVAGLVLSAPLGAPVAPDEADALRRTFALRDHADALALVDRLSTRPPLSRELAARWMRRAVQRPFLRRLLEAVDPAEALTPAELARVTAPVTLLWGAEERILPAHGVSFFRAHLPQAVVHELPGVGHSVMYDAPLTMLREARAHLRRATSATPARRAS